MRKFLFVALLLLPFITLAQVKPGIPISEVVRRAQAEVEASGKKVKKGDKSFKRGRYKTDRYSYSTANQRLDGVVQGDAYSYGDYIVEREPRQKQYRAPRARPDRSGWDNQFDFSREFGMSLSTNTLQWLTATPNAALTFQYDRFSLVVEGSFAFWDMPDYNYWRLLSVGGELRYDILPRLYVGATYSWNDYNLKLAQDGNQGVAYAIGAIIGYKLPVSNRCYFDFGLGLGYAYIDNEKYHHDGERFIRDEQRGFGYWGPIKAKASFSWRIF